MLAAVPERSTGPRSRRHSARCIRPFPHSFPFCTLRVHCINRCRAPTFEKVVATTVALLRDFFLQDRQKNDKRTRSRQMNRRLLQIRVLFLLPIFGLLSRKRTKRICNSCFLSFPVCSIDVCQYAFTHKRQIFLHPPP